LKRTVFVSSAVAATVATTLPRAASAIEEEVTLSTTAGNIVGTLQRPVTASRPPLALLIAGSGVSDRDGNSAASTGKNDALKLLTAALVSRGIATLRYDKRGVGASVNAGPRDEAQLRLDMYVDDAVAWIAWLRRRRDISRICVAGHSEGALVGMIAASRVATNGFVSLEGPGRPVSQILADQIHRRFPDLTAEADAAFRDIAAGRRARDVPPRLAFVLRPSVQPYMSSLFAHDPAVEIAKIRTPVAIVQGTADVQVTVEDAKALHAAQPTALYVLVDGMNHFLKYAPDTSSQDAIDAGYDNPALPVATAVVDAVARITAG
jgi:uncharacterized protein